MRVMCEQITGYSDRLDIDLIIVSFHWGYEMEYKHVWDQIRAARRVVDCGADVVVGTHPHVLQGMDLYKGKPVFYSLGNFCYGGITSPKDRDSAVMQLEYDISGAGKPELLRLEVFPYLFTGIPAKAQDYRPVPATGEDARRILKKLSVRTEGMPEGFFETGVWIK